MCSCANTLQHGHIFSTLLEKLSERSGYGVSFGTLRITDLDFADDAVMFAEALESMSEDAAPLGLRVS